MIRDDRPNPDGATDDKEWKKGSAELLIFSLLADRPRHGYEIAKLIEQRSGGTLRFRVTSLYPLLYRLEERGLIEGRWVEKALQRRRRYYRLTSAGGALLERQRLSWKAFVEAVRRVTGIEYD
jgi:PadR family transcriptional regulator, regulatory protein PadR